MNRAKLAVIAVVFLLAGNVLNPFPHVTSQEEEPRTWYEALDLDTPEQAVQTIGHAFSRQDFPTVFLILASDAQSQWIRALTVLDYDRLFLAERGEEIQRRVSLFSQGLGHGEHHLSVTSYLFDEIMLAAHELNGLLIDLSGEITIIGSKATPSEEDGTAVDVLTTVEGIEGTVVFRMVQAPSGRWRVLQVAVPGGDEEMFPWSIPSAGS